MRFSTAGVGSGKPGARAPNYSARSDHPSHIRSINRWPLLLGLLALLPASEGCRLPAHQPHPTPPPPASLCSPPVCPRTVSSGAGSWPNPTPAPPPLSPQDSSRSRVLTWMVQTVSKLAVWCLVFTEDAQVPPTRAREDCGFFMGFGPIRGICHNRGLPRCDSHHHLVCWRRQRWRQSPKGFRMSLEAFRGSGAVCTQPHTGTHMKQSLVGQKVPKGDRGKDASKSLFSCSQSGHGAVMMLIAVAVAIMLTLC